MRLKFIEYIINAACCECRCGRTMRTARFIVAYFEKSETKSDDLALFAKVSLVLRAITSSLDCKAQRQSRNRAARTDDFSNARHEIFNGGELNRDGKVNFLISGDASLPARRHRWNRLEEGTRRVAHLCHLPRYLADPPSPPPARLTPKYPANPFPQSRTLETSHLPLGRSSRLTLIQLKTSDRAKQRRIDHENFN